MRPSPTGTSVYTASQARLGGPIFTPKCLPKKTSCRGPSHKVHHTENYTYCLIAPPQHIACRGCTLIILRTQKVCGIFLQKLHVACPQLESHVFLCSHGQQRFLHSHNYPPSHRSVAHCRSSFCCRGESNLQQRVLVTVDNVFRIASQCLAASVTSIADNRLLSCHLLFINLC